VRRQSVRALDEWEFEQRTVADERDAVYGRAAGDLGEPFDVSAPPVELVAAMLRRIGIQYPISNPANIQ